jgi:hypothetical protein
MFLGKTMLKFKLLGSNKLDPGSFSNMLDHDFSVTFDS